MSELFEAVDLRTNLVRDNQTEVLLLTLGSREVFGINVFKVREVSKMSVITRAPNMPPGMVGLVTLRGQVIPVISLASVVGLPMPDAVSCIMLVAEFSRRTVAFMVQAVERIHCVNRDQVRPAEGAAGSSLVTSIVSLEDGRLVSMLDAEQILANVFGEAIIGDLSPVHSAAR